MRLLFRRPPLAPERLRLPRGVRFMTVEQDAVAVPEDVRIRIVEAAARTQGVRLTTGYVARASTAPAYAAIIKANVHADQLWRVMRDLVDTLLPIVAAPVIGFKGEAPSLGPYTHRERALGVFEPFVEQLTHDGFLEWGVMFQWRGVTEEIFVKSTKYVQIWTNDPPRAARVLHRHGIPEVPDLQFVDQYPFVSNTFPLYGRSSGWSVVLERVTAAFANLPHVQPP